MIKISLINILSDIFPESSHVKFCDLLKEDDQVIRNYAIKHAFTIVTQDSDFYDLAMIYGVPPKIIWIRSGNVSTKYVEKLIRDNVLPIRHFYNDESRICLELM